ncbi:short chain dehydrogenase reductase [Cercophora newfieldiana]|uniref:Short chain dehydrogenase reductase n=1 Tax=Cercophora newfieldiana TaxID=92897 RepID=A0AA39YS75_9PEZI|nr:short chain dehydrogenase reductase [Cercophora newfieldiana]
MASAPYIHYVLVTGANQGIGFETAKKLATEYDDYHVIMTGRRKDAIEDAVAKLNALGLKNVEAVVMDVLSDESIHAAIKQIDQAHGRLDVLINNAGISRTSGPVNRQTWLDIYNTNVAAVEIITDACIPLLKKSQVTKRIVNVTTNLASLKRKLDPTTFQHKVEYPPYSTSKTALNMLTAHYVVRYEDDPTWKINLTCPGFCATNLNGFAGFDDPASGAVNSVRLATLGPDGPTGTFTDKDGVVEW